MRRTAEMTRSFVSKHNPVAPLQEPTPLISSVSFYQPILQDLARCLWPNAWGNAINSIPPKKTAETGRKSYTTCRHAVIENSKLLHKPNQQATPKHTPTCAPKHIQTNTSTHAPKATDPKIYSTHTNKYCESCLRLYKGPKT